MAKKKLTKISVNIWDDYYDDDYVPPGKKQETRMYIEEYDSLNDEQKVPIVEFISTHLKTLDLTGVVTENDGSGISFTHLTHKRRERLVNELEAAKLMWEEIPFDFYSES